MTDTLPAGLTLGFVLAQPGDFCRRRVGRRLAGPGGTARSRSTPPSNSTAQLTNTAIDHGSRPGRSQRRRTTAIRPGGRPAEPPTSRVDHACHGRRRRQGQNATFTVTLTNSGPDAAHRHRGDRLDSRRAFRSSLRRPKSGTTYNANTWTIPTLASGEDVTLTIDRPGPGSGRSLTPLRSPTPTRSTRTRRPTTAGGRFCHGHVDAPQAAADLSLTITPPTQTPGLGQDATFTVTLTNGGPDAATNIVVTDVIPAGLVLQSNTPRGGTTY